MIIIIIIHITSNIKMIKRKQYMMTILINSNNNNDIYMQCRAQRLSHYGQFSKLHVCFCGLDAGNLQFETVRTNKQHICF